MKKIILITSLPGVVQSHFFKKHVNTINYTDWLLTEGVTKPSNRAGRHVIIDLYLMRKQFRQILKKTNLYIFSNRSWAEYESNEITSNIYIHMTIESYDMKALQSRSDKNLSISAKEMSNLQKWNANCVRMRIKNTRRSIMLEAQEFINLDKLNEKSFVSHFHTIDYIEQMCEAINYSSHFKKGKTTKDVNYV